MAHNHSLMTLPYCIWSCVLQEWSDLKALKTFNSACCNRLDRHELHELIRSEELSLYQKVMLENDPTFLWMCGDRSACSRHMILDDPLDESDARLEYITRFGSRVGTLEVRDGQTLLFNTATFTISSSCHSLRSLQYSNSSPGSRHILHSLLTATKHLESLKITSKLNGALSEDFADVHLPKLSSLSVLSLDCVSGILRAGNNITRMDLSNTVVTDFTELPTLFPHLRSLSLASSEITDSDLGAIVRGCPGIAHLDISGCQNITDKGIKLVVTNLKGLQSLNIDNCDSLTSHSLELITTHSAHTLEKLFMSSMDYNWDLEQRERDHVILDKLFEACQKLHTLQCYDFSHDNPPYLLTSSVRNLTTLLLGFDSVHNGSLSIVGAHCPSL